MRFKTIVSAGVFPNLDGVAGTTPVDEYGQGSDQPIYMRLLRSDSGHDLTPTGNVNTPEETDQAFLRHAVLQHLQSYLHPPTQTHSGGNTGAHTAKILSSGAKIASTRCCKVSPLV